MKMKTKRYNSLKKRYGLPLSFLMLFFITLENSAAQQGVTAWDIAKTETVTSSVVSGDGNYIAFTKSVPANPYKENTGNSSHLYLLNLEDGTIRPYYTQGSVASVQFRPGKETITFLTQRPGDDTRALYELPVDGGEAEKVYGFERNIISYTWNRSGNQIVFNAMDEAESTASPLPYQAEVYEENLPQRGAYIANVTATGSTPRRLNIEGSVYLMEWSPDGDHIAVSAAPTPNIDDFYMYQQVLVVSAQSGNVVSEINNEGKIGQLVWNPNGNRLAIRAGSNINDPTDGRILIASALGGVPELLDRDFEGKYEHIEWTDENTLHFHASESTVSVIGTIGSNGSGKQTLFRSDALAINSFSRSENGDITFVASSPEHPSEVYYLEDGRSQPERKTYHNAWLNNVDLGRQEVISYETRDGRFVIDGILIYPVNYRNGIPVPLITMVHGGPEAHYSNGWLTGYQVPGQVAAAKGYAVFYPNYRGSTGRGIDFVFSSQADLAGKEFDDIVDGIDHLVERGIADPDRIGVTGGSYGGYASAWMSTYYSDRFAAAVMFVGISNNLSKWGTSDIPEELYLVHSRERMWQSDAKWMEYLQRSPVYWVNRANTPILIMHGAEDTRVHPAQSLELYRHLKVRRPGVPARLVWYPGEGHGNTRASSRFDYTHRMFQWFDTYLLTGDRTAEMPHWDTPVPEGE